MGETSGPFGGTVFNQTQSKPVKLWLLRLMLSSPRGNSPRTGGFFLFFFAIHAETLTPNLLVAIRVLLNPQRRLDKLHLIIMSYPGGKEAVKISVYHNVMAPHSRSD